MVFNSFEFLLFFPIVCGVYYLLKINSHRNIFLLLASYYFYMNWKPVYALLILFSTILTYACGLFVEKNLKKRKRKKIFLTCSFIINFSLIFLFKYYNFINESIWNIMDSFGILWEVPNLDVLLPVGISFYTFQAVGYTIDVYRGDIKAEKNFFIYALFVSFFPQLVAGPIERAKNLLPQFHREHHIKYKNISEGLKLMLWGYFMKLCVAERLGEYVDAVYNNPNEHTGSSLLLATFMFAFQIYCDFGGYSNIARGVAKIMDFDLMENFHRPYLSLSIKEFWKRWHISLSTWLMDYIYIPLGGNRVKYSRHLMNLMITFLVSGIWHGANWTFIIWGIFHGICIIMDNVINKFFLKSKGNASGNFKVLNILCCFCIVSFAWIFFRANNITDAITIINKIFFEQGSLFLDMNVLSMGFMSLFILILKDIKDELGWNFHLMHSKNKYIRYSVSIVIVCYILLFGVLNSSQFIYFQF